MYKVSWYESLLIYVVKRAHLVVQYANLRLYVNGLRFLFIVKSINKKKNQTYSLINSKTDIFEMFCINFVICQKQKQKSVYQSFLSQNYVSTVHTMVCFLGAWNSEGTYSLAFQHSVELGFALWHLIPLFLIDRCLKNTASISTPLKCLICWHICQLTSLS